MSDDRDALPKGWTAACLPELIGPDGMLTDGDWVETKDQDPNGEVRLTQLADIGDGEFRDRSHRFLTMERAAALGCTFLREGDVLVARMPDPLGRACVFPGDHRPCVTAVDVCVIRPGNGLISSRWVMNFINTPAFRAAIAGLQAGSTRKRISKKNLCSIPLPVPPAPEQRRIVEAIESHLTRLDDAVATLERVQRNLNRYQASVLKAAVEGRLVPTEAELAHSEGRDYETASVLLERILAERRSRWEASGRKGKYQEPSMPDTTDLPELPEGWVWASIDQLGDISGGLTMNARRDGLSMRLPYLRVGNVYADELRLDDVKDIGVKQAEVARASLAPGDLLVVEGNGSIDQIGRVALWDGSIRPCLHQNHLIKVRFEPLPMGRWSLTWLLSPSGRRVVEKVASSTSGLHTLSISKVAALPTPLCPLAEQARVVAEVDRLLSLGQTSAAQVATTLRRCVRLRQAVLKRAFEGKLAEQDSKDEPASVLLTRITAKREAAGTTTKKNGPPSRPARKTA